MALNRSALADELAAHAGGWLRAVELHDVDSTGALKEPLDATLRTLGVAYADLPAATIDETELDRFLAVGSVYVLRRALQEATGFADVTATGLGVSKRKSQITEHLRHALAAAESVAASYGVVGLTGTMSSGVLILDGVA